jgi:hypothetical protein
MAFGQPKSLGRASACTAHTLHVGVWPDRRGGEATGGEPTVKTELNLGQNSPRPTSYMPLHRSLIEEVGKYGLTVEAFRAAASNGRDGGNRLRVGAKSFDWPQ